MLQGREQPSYDDKDSPEIIDKTKTFDACIANVRMMEATAAGR
jgi:hypothetical protein